MKRRVFHEPLRPQDSPTQTVGCRLTNPDTCAKHSLPKMCAFVRADGLCLSPPGSWRKQYQRLLAIQNGEDPDAPKEGEVTDAPEGAAPAAPDAAAK